MCEGSYRFFRKCQSVIVWQSSTTPAGIFITLKPNPERIALCFAIANGDVSISSLVNGVVVYLCTISPISPASRPSVDIQSLGSQIQGTLVLSASVGPQSIRVTELNSPKDYQ